MSAVSKPQAESKKKIMTDDIYDFTAKPRDTNVFKPPVPAPATDNVTVFLAGSIDMGSAPDWQRGMAETLDDLPVMFFNPRRDDWDSTWQQDISNDGFRDQVEWELDHLDRSDVIVMYFSPTGPGPISLMELGLYAVSGKCIVCCPEGYWRRGNVQIVCKRFGVPLCETIEELYDHTRYRVSHEISKKTVDRFDLID